MGFSLLDVLFPMRCVGCCRGPWPLCATCQRAVVWFDLPACARCGRPLPASATNCGDCPPSGVTWSRAPCLYEGPIRNALMRLKFGGQRSVAEPFASWMVDALSRARPDRTAEDLVVSWVPLGRKRRRARGFDQAELLARAVAARTGWPMNRLLARVVETAPQARRSGQERQAALKGAFQATTSRLPESVLLIDDVLTSGATAAECARVLIGNGVREIGVLTAARSLGSGLPGRCYNPPGLQPGSVVARERFSR